MKYSCDVIQDLLPLYYDEVCSMESRHIVEEHIRECMYCKKVYEELSTDSPGRPQVNSCKEQKADFLCANSLREVKKAITCKQIIGIIVTIVVLSFAALVFVKAMKYSEQKINSTENISVAMVDGNIMGRLLGSKWHNAFLKRVEVDGKNYIFFSFTDTKWDRLITGPEIYSEYLICSKDKGADHIDAVYYYPGDYSNLEDRKMQELTGQSTLLWEKR